jgi:hypothetical protein
MSRLQRDARASMREQAMGEPLLRHYRDIGAKAIAAALDIDGETVEAAKAPDCGAQDALPPFLLSCDHAAANPSRSD